MVGLSDNANVERRFSNSHGEELVVRINVGAGSGQLFGDDIGWDEPIEIRDDEVDLDFILADDERDWLERTWHEATGRSLQLSVFDRIAGLLGPLFRAQQDQPAD